MPNRLTALLSRFRRDRKANVAIIFALSVLPVLTAIGCATDYTNATRIKAKMQAAADAAAVASVSINSASYNQAVTMTANGPVSAGVTELTSIFNGNVYNFASLYQNLSLSTATVTKTGANLTSVIKFSAQVPVVFMKVLGWQTMTIGGSSTATSSLPLYLDFYLLLDVSGSMGLPSTPAEAARLQWVNPDDYVDYPTGCTLACHFPTQYSACQQPTIPAKTLQSQSGYPTNGYCLGYMISRVSQSGLLNLLQVDSTKSYPYTYPTTSNCCSVTSFGYNSSLAGKNLVLKSSALSSLPSSTALGTPVANCPSPGTDACIQLRLDAVGYAVTQLFNTANSVEKIPNQFRIGLYPYITSLYSTYAPLTSSIGSSSSISTAAANLATLLDTNLNSSLGSGGTNQDAALSGINSLITSVGDGSASNKTLPYIFMVTDGAVTPQTKGVPNGGWSGSNHDTTISLNDTNCTALKNRGITISILNIPFQPINPVNKSFAGDEDDYANNNIPNIDPSLKACASPGFYYTANTPQDITDALNQMFNHALVEAHMTN